MCPSWPIIAVPVNHSNEGPDLRGIFGAIHLHHGLNFLGPRLNSLGSDPMSEEITLLHTELALERVDCKSFCFKSGKDLGENLDVAFPVITPNSNIVDVDFKTIDIPRSRMLQGQCDVQLFCSKAASCCAASNACNASTTSPKSPSMMESNLYKDRLIR